VRKRESAVGGKTRQGVKRQTLDRARQLSGVTTLASWAKAVGKALEAEGIDSGKLLEEAGIDRRLFADPNARCPQEQLTRLWHLAVHATGDEAFGLKVSHHIGATTFHALGYAITASGTLREIFERCARYLHVVSNAAELHFERIGSEYHVQIQAVESGPQPSFESMDAFAALCVRMCRGRVGRQYAPLRMRLRRPRPEDTWRFDKVFRTAIEYGASENRLVFDRATFERPLEDSNPELAAHNEQVLVRVLAQVEKTDVRARVRAVLAECLSLGEPCAGKIASELHMSLRSLQRKLAAAGTNYEQVLNDTRRELAQRYIADSRYSISEITYLLGFSDTSSFTRAFRRWNDCSPTEFRVRAAREPRPPRA
jgi:AraC-like DNA-binding protein